MRQAEGVADRHHGLADQQVGAAAQRLRRQVARAVHLEHREVGVAVRAHHVGLELAAVVEGDQDARRAFDDVRVGDHEPARIDDQPRAQRLRPPPAATAEEAGRRTGRPGAPSTRRRR